MSDRTLIRRTPTPPPSSDTTPTPTPAKATEDTHCRACLVHRDAADLEMLLVPGLGKVPVCVDARGCRLTGEARGVWCTIPPAAAA